MLAAGQDPELKAIVVFSGGGYSWTLSPQLRNLLISTVKNIKAPVMIIHAQNDYSTAPGYVLDSVMNRLGKPHLLKFYPKIGTTANDGHNLIFLNPQIWESDVFKFLDENL